MRLYSPVKRPRFAEIVFMLAVLITSTTAIREGRSQQRQEEQIAQLLAQASCGNGICEEGEDTLLCPPCAVDATGNPIGKCECTLACEPDCARKKPPPPPPDPCALKECPFGCENGTCITTCVSDCTPSPKSPPRPPEKPDPCRGMDCTYGCRNGQCLPDPAPPEDLCKKKFCTYGCVNGTCLPPPAPSCEPYVCVDGSTYPRCSDDGTPINYFVDPCASREKFCHSSQDCKNGMTCTVEMGDCMADPSCPECDACTGTCIFTDRTQTAGRVQQKRQPTHTSLERVFLETRSQEKLPLPVENRFSDMDLSDEVGKAANLLREANIISGYPDGSFRKNSAVIRAEAAKMLLTARYGEFPNTENNGRFWDIEDGAWYTKYVSGAANLGIIAGYPDGSFRPDAHVNTAEFLKMLIKTFDLETGLPYYFADVPPNAWYAPYVGIAEKLNLFPNRIATLGPTILLTRGEVALAIARVLHFAQ